MSEPTPTIPGAELVPEAAQNLVNEFSFKLITFSYFVMSELITILVKGGMPKEQAMVRATKIVRQAMEKFRDSEAGKQ